MQQFTQTIDTMASIANISFEAIQEAARAQKVPRGLTRALMPIVNAEVVAPDTFDGVAFLAGGILVVIDPSRCETAPKETFAGVVAAAKEKTTLVGDANADGANVDEDDTGAVDGEGGADDGEVDGEGEAGDGDAAQTAIGVIDKPLDMVVWTKVPDDDQGTVSVTFENGEVYVQIADSGTNAEMVCELVTAIFKAVTMPFEGNSGGRRAWKESQRPRITREYVEGDGQFKISFEKRFDAIFKNADGRIQTTFDHVFDAKVTSAARGAVGRYARKNKLGVTWKKPAKDSGASAGPSSDKKP